MITKHIIILLTIFIFQQLFAQESKKYIYLDDPTNTYLDYLINSGKLETDFVLWQPYQTTVLDSVETNDKATNYFKRFWLNYYKEDELSLQLDAKDELRAQKKVYNRWALTGGVHHHTGCGAGSMMPISMPMSVTLTSSSDVCTATGDRSVQPV
jgi:hypothetical protein